MITFEWKFNPVNVMQLAIIVGGGIYAGISFYNNTIETRQDLTDLSNTVTSLTQTVSQNNFERSNQFDDLVQQISISDMNQKQQLNSTKDELKTEINLLRVEVTKTGAEVSGLRRDVDRLDRVDGE